MLRRTVILSDLYLSTEAITDGLPATQALPSLDGLLRFADVEHIGDWRQWLIAEAGGRRTGHRLATVAADEGLREASTAWIATPVHLEARLDHVRLVDRGLLRVAAEESAVWCAEFAQVFGPQYGLHPGGERAFFLSGLRPTAVSTPDPARWLGGEIGPALPGPDAPELRRLWTEIEMWLHSSATNAARERAGSRRLSALWLWGNDPVPAHGASLDPGRCRFDGGDPLIRRLQAGAAPGSVHEIVERAPLTGAERESMAALERDLFAPARAALSSGELGEFTLIANDRRFVIRPRSAWKRWRRRRTWLESLA